MENKTMNTKFEFYKVNINTLAIDIANMDYYWQRFFKENFQDDILDNLYYFQLNDGESTEDFFKKLIQVKGDTKLKKYEYKVNKL